MKRLKDLLLSLFIFGSIVVVIFIILSFFNVKQTINIGEDISNEKMYNNLIERVNMLNDGTCKDYLHEFIKTIDNGNLKGEVKLSSLYNYYLSFNYINLYEKAEKECSITKDEIEEYGIAGKYINLMLLPETLFNKYMFAYEFSIKDELRSLTEANTDILTFRSIRFNQLSILKDYVTIAESREVTNE